jgi:hypothetical protein
MSSTLTPIGGSRTSAAFGSGGARTVQDTHPLARGCCSPCDTVFTTLQSAQEATRAGIRRPVTSPRPVRENPAEPRSRAEGDVEAGDIVRLSSAGRVVKVEPTATGESAAAGDRPRGESGSRGDRPVFKTLRSGGAGGQGPRELEAHELRELEQLAQRDKEVRAHEQAHKAAAGSHAGAISLSYRTGPDGQRYAVAGEVPVDLSPVRGDPSATVRKMTQIRQAALAPADPSAADRAAASRATALMQKAQADLAEVQSKRVEAARAGARPESASEGGPSSEAAASASASGTESRESGSGSPAAELEPGAAEVSTAAAAAPAALRFYARG